MQLSELGHLDEAKYPGNIGMMEMFKFYQLATEEQKNEMKKLIADKLFDKCWELMELVTGTKIENV